MSVKIKLKESNLKTIYNYDDLPVGVICEISDSIESNNGRIVQKDYLGRIVEIGGEGTWSSPPPFNFTPLKNKTKLIVNQ